MENNMYYNQTVAARASEEARADFIRKTYLHLAFAILGFIGLEYALLQQAWVSQLVNRMIGGGGFNWLIVLGLFMGVSWIANKWAHSDASQGMQYAGLALYVAAEAIVFIPLLYIAMHFTSPDVIPTAAMITGALFVGLSFIVFTTKKNFSFMGSVLKVGFFVALGVIIASIVFGFSLGLVFSGVMVVLASGMILYTTSNVLHEYGTSQYVAASLALFASVALLFWYVLRIVMAFGSNE